MNTRRVATILLFSILAIGTVIDISGEKKDIDLYTEDGIEYITTDQLSEFSIVKGRFFSPVKNKETQKWNDLTLVFTPFSPFLVIDKEAYSMGVATKVDTRGHFVPLWGLMRVVSKVTDISFDIDYADSQAESPVIPDTDTQMISPPDQGWDREFEAPEIWTVVVDPGHGGKDPGAIGKGGTYEKDIVLAIAKKIQDLSDTDRYEKLDIALTRDTDIFLPLNKRGEIAAQKGGHIFVSVHCNASDREAPHGVETFFLSPAKTSGERATEILENSAALLEDDSEQIYEETSDFIFADFLQNEFIRESSRLSDFIQAQISEDSGIHSRGKSKAAFYVLKDVVMPAVLVEVAFISNPEEENLLKTEDFQKKVATSILDGILSFTNEFDE